MLYPKIPKPREAKMTKISKAKALIKAMAVQADIEGMKADNEDRANQGHVQAWDGDMFREAYRELNEIADSIEDSDPWQYTEPPKDETFILGLWEPEEHPFLASWNHLREDWRVLDHPFSIPEDPKCWLPIPPFPKRQTNETQD
jgi:hypothetical protein